MSPEERIARQRLDSCLPVLAFELREIKWVWGRERFDGLTRVLSNVREARREIAKHVLARSMDARWV